MQGVAVAWIITGMTTAPWLVALVPVAASLPSILVSLPAGVLGDLFGRAVILRVASLWIAGGSFLLAGLALGGWLSPWSLLGLLFFVGMGHSARLPSWSASIQDLVSPEQVASAVSLNSLSFNTARSIGPSLGGLLVGLFGAGWVLLLNAILATGVFFAVGTWRPRLTLPARSGSWLQPMREAFSLLGQSPPLRRILYRLALINFAAAGLWAFLPLIGRDRLGLLSWQYGLLLSAMGVGAILGASLAPRLRNWLGPRRMVSVAAGLLGLSVLWLAWAQTAAAAITGIFFCGLAVVNCNINLNVSFQMRAPAETRGRLMAVYFLIFELGLAVGAGVLGWLATWWDISWALVLSSVLLIASPWLVPRRRLESHAGSN